MKEICRGLGFPEGPVAMPDGSVILVEIQAGTLTRVKADGTCEVVAECGGGPNGAALGPDGRMYVCNNGGFVWMQDGPFLRSGDERPDNYTSGSIQAVDLKSGAVETLYTECNGEPLKGPNDIVFDAGGGFYFTDLGRRRGRQIDRGAVYYAKPDGSSISELVFPIDTPNGIGLSADEKTLYVADTSGARIWSWDILSPGKLGPAPHRLHPGRLEEHDGPAQTPVHPADRRQGHRHHRAHARRNRRGGCTTRPWDTNASIHSRSTAKATSSSPRSAPDASPRSPRKGAYAPSCRSRNSTSW